MAKRKEARLKRKAAEANGTVVEHTYFVFHKPPGCLTERPSNKTGGPTTVYDVLPVEYKTAAPVPHVGRLDKESEGLLLFTDDGMLAQALIDPTKSAAKPAKTYHVLVSGLAWTEADTAWHDSIEPDEVTGAREVPIAAAADGRGGNLTVAEPAAPAAKKAKLECAVAPRAISAKGWKWHTLFGTAKAQLIALRQPMKFDPSKAPELETQPVVLRVLPLPAPVATRLPEEEELVAWRKCGETPDTRWLEFELREGKNKQIRKLCARSGLKVHALRRVAIGPIQLGELPPGAARPLTEHELRACRALLLSP